MEVDMHGRRAGDIFDARRRSLARKVCVWLLSAVAGALVMPAVASAWAPPVDLSPQSEFDMNLSAAMTAAGATGVAWQWDVDAFTAVVQARLRPVGRDWGPIQTLGYGQYPSLALDRRGDALAVWYGGKNALQAAYAPAGQAFGSQTAVGAGYDGALYPFVAFDDGGTATALFATGDHQIFAAVRAPGHAFSSPKALPGVIGAQWPDYAVAGNGDAVAVWSDYGTSYAAIRSGDGAAFSAPEVLDSTNQSGGVHVAMDPRGDAVAVWADQINNQGYMRAAIRRAGMPTFDPAVTIALVYYTATFDANVAMDNAGDATIVWLGGSDSPALQTGATAVQRPVATGQWGAPEPLGSPGPDYEPPVVAYDAAGDAYAVWRHYDVNTDTSIQGRILAEEAPAHGGFPGQPQTISENDHNVWQPVLAAGPPSGVLAAWPLGTFYGNASHFWVQAADLIRPQITPPSPGPHPSACVVPKLTGLTLKQARRRVAAAHCGLRVQRRRAARYRGRVVWQAARPAAGFQRDTESLWSSASELSPRRQLELALRMFARDLAEYVSDVTRRPWPGPSVELRVNVNQDTAVIGWNAPGRVEPLLTLGPIGRAELNL